jgi:hypothetical protein
MDWPGTMKTHPKVIKALYMRGLSFTSFCFIQAPGSP